MVDRINLIIFSEILSRITVFVKEHSSILYQENGLSPWRGNDG